MAGTLKDDLAVDAANLLNTDEFAEVVTFKPAEGPSRRVTVIVHEETGRQDVRGAMRRQTDTVQVFVLKNQSHATKGGIATPQRLERGADSFERDGETGGRYVYTGRVVSADAATWTLEYERPKLRSIGTEHRT